MSFYLTRKTKIQNNKSVKYFLPDIAQNRTGLLFPERSMHSSDKRAAFCTFKGPKGSLTPEAAWVIPLFFLMFITLIGLMDVYGIYVENMVEVQEQAEKLGMYAATATAVSSDLSSESMVEKNSTETYHPLWLPFPFPGIQIHVKARVRPWRGRTGEEIAAAGSSNRRMVYVTEWESVYHTTSRCTYLSLSIQQVSASLVGSRRNAWGKSYTACEKCVGKKGKNSLLYITEQGDRYHNSLECSGLKRSVVLKEESELEGLHCCSRCSALEAAS